METSLNDPHAERLKRALEAVRSLRSKVSLLEGEADVPIAIVGAGCRFPGGVNHLDSYWSLLLEGRIATGPVPSHRWDAQALYDPQPGTPGKCYVREGGFLKDNLFLFEPETFGLSEAEACSLDPMHRLLLEVHRDALEHASIPVDQLHQSKTGVYVGMAHSEHKVRVHQLGPDAIDAYTGTGNTSAAACGRIAYWLGSRGPTWAVDTACSSSLVALHHALGDLRRGAADVALVSGVNVLLDPHAFVYLCAIQALAPDGRSKPFSAAADGYGRGEGAAALVLKRLPDAERSGDRILALIRGSAVNHDGRSNGLTAPSGPAQEAVIREALLDAKLDPNQVGWVECHGTGTPLGDPVEIGALCNAYSERNAPLVVGAVKANLGHLESAAGLAGLLKVALAMHHGTLPPQPPVGLLNPLLTDAPIRIPEQPEPLPGRFGATSAFGIGGTNTHVILEVADKAPSPSQEDTPLVVLPLSADSPQALKTLCERWHLHLSSTEDRPLDLGHTAWRGRTARSCRITAIGSSLDALAASLREATHCSSDEGPVRVGFAFTGQGAQHAGMALDLYATQPVFRMELDRCAEILDPLLGRPLLELLAEKDLLGHTRVTQPVLAAVEWSMVQLWRSWGVHPSAVVGHSLGEWVAAATAGVLDPDDMLRAVVARGACMGGLPPGGAMAAIPASSENVAPAIEGLSVHIAAENHPTETVISGTEEEVHLAEERLAKRGYTPKRLRVSHAFHSHLMDPAIPDLIEAFARCSMAEPQIPFISGKTGSLETEAWTQPAHWADSVRSPVRFARALEAFSEHVDVILEIGPAPVLCGMAAHTTQVRAIPSQHRGAEGNRSWLEAAAQLWESGVPVSFPQVEGARTCDIPLTPYVRRPLQLDPPPTLPGCSIIEWVDREIPSPTSPLAATLLGDPAGVESLTPLCSPGKDWVWIDPGGDALDRTDSALQIIQQALNTHPRPRLSLVTRRAWSGDPRAAAIWGLGRCAALELPDLKIRLVDMEEEGALPNVARVLASDIEEDGWWVSETGVKVPRLIDVPLPPARFQPRHGTWVITGGRGALGLHVARFLAEKGASHLRLSGRSEPSQEDRVAFEALRTLGAHVEYVTSDVHVEKDVENLLKADPPVVGIVHAAGVLDDHSILHLNRGHLDRAGQAKIIGTQHLVRYVQAHDLPLQALVWFSSLAGVCGSPGQGNYAAANAYLDALSSTLRAQGLPSLSIAWGPWAGGGMALDTAQRRSEEGIQPMDPSPALQAMEALLTDAPSSVCVADVDWSAAAQRFARVPSLIRERVGDAQTTRSNLSSNQVEAMVSRVLGIPIPVPKNRGFADLGMDSVQGLELARALGKQLGEPLPPTLAWDHPTLEALADHLTEKTAKTSEAAPPIVGATQAGIDLMGWALRVPGASSAEELWQNWMAGTSTMRPFPDDRFQGNDWADIQPPEKGGFLDGVDLFDAEHFGISAREASTLDPQQRLLLELTWEALLDAGLDPDDTRGRSIGVFLSMGGSDYAHLLGKAGLLATEPHAGSGNDPAFAAGRIAHTFGWTGPALVVQTACPGGLAALNMAARALDDGSCELALVGGVHLSLSPEPFAYQSRIEALSPDGETRSFLADANGYGRSEGAAVVVVRPAGGDSPSYGTLLGSAIEHVGASASLTAPSGPPQESVALRALQQAGVNAGDIGYIEAHGTARPTSDAIEIGALSSVYGDPENSPAIGTIKTIVGHTETASGLVGTIAACLVAHHQTVPGHPFKGPAGAHLKGQGLDLSPQTRPMQGLVAIHAYGLSGTVAHAVLRAGARAPGPSPSLPFSRRRWWYTRSSRPGRRLPGSICVWERVLLPSEGLGDHRIGNEVVVPATEWVAWVLEACASVERPTQLMDVTFCAPTTLSDNGRTAQLSFLPGDRWQISVASDNGWIVAAHGGLTSGGTLSSPPSLPTPKRSTDALYTAFQNTGQDYGPRFALLDKLHLGEDPTRASATLKGGALEGLLDAGLQLRAALAEPGAALVPFSIDRVIATGSLDSLSSVVLEVEGDENETWISHIWWCNPEGACVLEMEGQASRTVGGQDRRLMIPTDGVLDHLYWGPHESPEPLEDEVRIEVHAAGLNFRDVLAALGAYPGPSHPLGAECVGVVESCGPLATLQPGQRVMAFGPGTMASRVTLPAAGVIGLPETIHDVEAATLPVVFLTAWVALREVAQLKEGETILIHAAAGGVGMAAVQIARLLGARVFGTAHPRKWDSLKDQGVTQMASSRDPAFSNEFTEPVDVVLNSLTGPFIDASIQLLRPGGRFVELGKRDLRSPEAFPKTCTYTPFDIGVWGQSDPKALQQAMAEILQHIEAGELRPLPYRVFPFAQATQAFRHLAEAAHIGKVVLTRSEVQEGPTERTSTLPPDRSGVQRFVASLVAEVLGLSEPPELHRPLKELGMDSLLAIELRNRLSNLSGQAFPATLVFTHPTTQALIDRLAPAPDEDGLSEEELLAALDEELKDL